MNSIKRKLRLFAKREEKIVSEIIKSQTISLENKNKKLIETENKISEVRLGLFFKDFAAWLMDTSSVGLNVAGFTTASVLKDIGINTHVFPVRHNVDVVNAINKFNEKHGKHLTHVVISAPWMSAFDMESLVSNFKHIKFIVLSHSNVGFLQADWCGMELLRTYLEISKKYSNFYVGGNSKPFVEWMKQAYDCNIVYLPNLYPIKNALPTKVWNGQTLKIGAFGAIRPYKNFMTAAAAALVIQRETGVPTEFHMSDGGEGDKNMIVAAIEAMLLGTSVTLIKHKWEYWNNFIELVGSMDILLQMSYTESFNLITADGILKGVPSVVGPAIRWVPEYWKANADDAVNVAQTGIKLLTEPFNSYAGIEHLKTSNEHGVEAWLKELI